MPDKHQSVKKITEIVKDGANSLESGTKIVAAVKTGVTLTVKAVDTFAPEIGEKVHHALDQLQNSLEEKGKPVELMLDRVQDKLDQTISPKVENVIAKVEHTIAEKGGDRIEHTLGRIVDFTEEKLNPVMRKPAAFVSSVMEELDDAFDQTIEPKIGEIRTKLGAKIQSHRKAPSLDSNDPSVTPDLEE